MLQDVKANILELSFLRRNHTPLIQDDVEVNKPPPTKEPGGGRFGGWKGTLYLGSITSFIVLIFNLVMLCWATLRHPNRAQSVIYSGDCDRVKEISAGIHFVINIFSTLLLSAGHFGMQCLSAPTRQDVNRAHGREKWLDIGVPSVRNLCRIPRTRFLIWLSLVVSSVPLHLFYNSTVYSTIVANAYDVYVGNSTFTSLQPNDVRVVYDEDIGLEWSPQSAVKLVNVSTSLEKLVPQDCISAYATTFQARYSNVVLISDEFTGVNTSIHRVDGQEVVSANDYTDIDPYRWICAEQRGPVESSSCANHLSEIRSQDVWIVRGYKVDYCLAERAPEKCTLEYSLPLAIAVICTNFIKAILICLAAVLLRDRPLLTIGDAISSFLRVPDESTRGKCLLSREVASRRQPISWRLYAITSRATTYCLSKLRNVGLKVPGTLGLGLYSAPISKDYEQELKYEAQPKRRWSSSSTARWVICLFTYISSMGLCLGLLIYGLARMDNTDRIWDSGLASVDTKTMIDSLDWPGGLIPNTLIANIPQLIFSVLYFMSNSVLTSMTLAVEWNSFSLKRKGLRVSSPPQGQQRRTHFLSLPYRYGVPLITLSTLLHWLMSQSIFLVRILAWTQWGERNPSGDTMTVGYSPPAIVIGLCVGALLPAGLVLMGRRRFRSGMPVAGSCSLAIAAACHPQTREDEEIEYQLLKWGVELDQTGDVGHCTFSSENVQPPEDGIIYR
ncbi:hypothetical protein BJX99DRAFT_164303 [Aspergillus californicus]